MSQKIDLSVSNEFSGVRIDKFLAENIDFLTRSMISKLILTVEIHQCLILHQE